MWTQPLPLPYQLLTSNLPDQRPFVGQSTLTSFNPINYSPAYNTFPQVDLQTPPLLEAKKVVLIPHPPVITDYSTPKATAIQQTVSANSQVNNPSPTVETQTTAETHPVTNARQPDAQPVALTDNNKEYEATLKPLDDTDALSPEVALQRVQSPIPLPTRPIEAARSFQILPNGTVVDSAKMPLLPQQEELSAKPAWQQHLGALIGAGLGTIAGVKLYHTLKPLNLKRLYWEPSTKWPKFNQLVSTVSQPTLKGLRENTWLNNSLTWCKATMYLTPVMTGALWGERYQKRRKKVKKAKLLSVNA